MGITIDSERSSDSDQRAFASGDLGQVQELLFGEHIRSLEQTVADVQHGFERQIEQLTQHFEQRDEQSRVSLMQEISSLRTELAKERAGRLASEAALGESLEQAVQSLRLQAVDRQALSGLLVGIASQLDDPETAAISQEP